MSDATKKTIARLRDDVRHIENLSELRDFAGQIIDELGALRAYRKQREAHGRDRRLPRGRRT